MKIGLGTVQFGLDYGVSNTKGRVSRDEVQRILALAASAGMSVLDTATTYGESERVIGESLGSNHQFRIVTKTPPLKTQQVDEADVRKLTNAFFQSLDRLRQDSLYAVLVHHADDLLVEGSGRVIGALNELKEDGRVKKIGVSVYTGEQIDRVLEVFVPDIVQLPVNLFDQRLVRSGHLAKLKQLGVEIHARSVFLQGLLLMDVSQLSAYFTPIRAHFQRYLSVAKELKLTQQQLSLFYVNALPDVDTVLVGVCTAEQFQEILAAFRTLPDTVPDLHSLGLQDERYINPSLWQLA